MVSAIVDGLLSKGAVAPADLACQSGSGRTAEALSSRTGIAHARSLDALIQGRDVFVLGFKPYHLAGADPRLAGLTEGRLVISVVGAKRLDQLEKVFPKARNIIRAMPNTPSRIGAGVSAWCSLRPLIASDAVILDTILGSIGTVEEISESQMNLVTAYSGSGPAYLFEFAAALRDAGIAAGLEPSMAQRLIVQTLFGSAQLLCESGIDPETLRNQVTSPNGVTLAGLRTLEAGRFRALIRDAIAAGKARCDELTQEG